MRNTEEFLVKGEEQIAGGRDLLQDLLHLSSLYSN